MIKTRLLSIFLTLALVSTLLLSNTFAQDYLQWELPDGAIARIGKGGVGDIQYSPDGRFLAVSNRIGIWLYDTATLQEAAFLTGDTDGITNISLSPDRRTFAMGKYLPVAAVMGRFCCGGCVNADQTAIYASNLTVFFFYVILLVI